MCTNLKNEEEKSQEWVLMSIIENNKPVLHRGSLTIPLLCNKTNWTPSSPGNTAADYVGISQQRPHSRRFLLRAVDDRNSPTHNLFFQLQPAIRRKSKSRSQHSSGALESRDEISSVTRLDKRSLHDLIKNKTPSEFRPFFRSERFRESAMTRHCRWIYLKSIFSPTSARKWNRILIWKRLKGLTS